MKIADQNVDFSAKITDALLVFVAVTNAPVILLRNRFAPIKFWRSGVSHFRFG